MGMLAIIAAIIFAIAWIINATGTATNAWFSVTDLLLIGLACLASLLARRPVMFYLGRWFATGGDPAKIAEFDHFWELPGAPRRFRMVTVVWGVALVAETFVRTALAFTISTQHFLEIAPVLGWGVIGALLWYTTTVTRAGEREAEALAAEALAAPAPAD